MTTTSEQHLFLLRFVDTRPHDGPAPAMDADVTYNSAASNGYKIHGLLAEYMNSDEFKQRLLNEAGVTLVDTEIQFSESQPVDSSIRRRRGLWFSTFINKYQMFKMWSREMRYGQVYRNVTAEERAQLLRMSPLIKQCTLHESVYDYVSYCLHDVTDPKIRDAVWSNYVGRMNNAVYKLQNREFRRAVIDELLGEVEDGLIEQRVEEEKMFLKHLNSIPDKNDIDDTELF